MTRMPSSSPLSSRPQCFAGTASATPFGQHVAECAHQLGARDEAPTVTCTHDGMKMAFANFGEMVEHMRAMH